MMAIDPGQKGGIAWIDYNDGLIIKTMDMPIGMTKQSEAIRELSEQHKTCYLEEAGKHIKGNNAQSSCTFARHCGHLEAILYMCGIAVIQVQPKEWMAHIGKMPKLKAARKEFIREQMARRYPYIDVTLKNADALGILTYVINTKGVH